MEVGDLPLVMEIEARSFPNPWHESTFRGEIQHRPISFPLVVVHNTIERVIGYIIFWLIGDEAQINNIAIHPDFRQMGIGEAVMRQVIQQLRSSGAVMVTLEVRPSNAGAQALYRKLGFRMIGIRKGYYTNPSEDAFVLSLHL